MRYQLILHDDLRAQIDALNAARRRDPRSAEAKEYVAVIKGLKALQEGQESEYVGKRLGYGPQSHDLRDCAELKVPVVQEFRRDGRPMGPSHRLIYREFDPVRTVEDNQVVTDPNAPPYRHVIAFAHRADEPAAITGQRLGRQRGLQVSELQGLTGGGRPHVGPEPPGVPTTPHRLPVPSDLVHQAAMLAGSPPPGTKPAPQTAPEATANRPQGPGGRSRKSAERG